MVIEINKTEIEKALLVGLANNSRDKIQTLESLDELAELTIAANASVVDQVIQVRARIDPAYYIGRGFAEKIKEKIQANGANTVIFDETLSPAQQRNLEKLLEVKVIDRPILILDIFATRARTAAAKLQVELAQLEYMLPRLTGAWVHFSRQYGGIGAKGPGETQLEIDRRLVRTKISRLKEKLKKLGIQRETQRKKRQGLFKVALVGYTNAGKSTLFNLLTKADVRTENMLFTTLDSTTRVMSSGYPCVVVFSDTVGFIKKLPHELIESFKSTLEEVAYADLLLHIVDCSDEKYVERIEQTNKVLKDIGAGEVPSLLVYNKLDLMADFIGGFNGKQKTFYISAKTKIGLSSLQAEIIAVSSQNLRQKIKS